MSWGVQLTTLLNRMGSKTFCLFNSPPQIDCLDFLRHRHNVASLSLFYRYFHTYCSSELANCMTPPLPWSHCTIRSTFSHLYFGHLFNARVNLYVQSFIPYTGKLQNFFLCQFFHLPISQTFSKEECQDTYNVNWISNPCFYFSYCIIYKIWRQA